MDVLRGTVLGMWVIGLLNFFGGCMYAADPSMTSAVPGAFRGIIGSIWMLGGMMLMIGGSLLAAAGRMVNHIMRR